MIDHQSEQKREADQLRKDLTKARDELEGARAQLTAAGDKVKELRELVSLHRDACGKSQALLARATRALERAGYTDDGAEEWRPPADTVAGELQRQVFDLQGQLAERAKPGQIRDMALLIGRLSYQLNKARPANEFSRRATAYLQKHNLIGSPLRAEDMELRSTEGDAAEQLQQALATLEVLRDPVTAAHYAMSRLTVEGMADYLDDHREVWAVLAGEMEHIELKQATTWPARTVRMTFTHPKIGDERLTPLLVNTLHMLATHMQQADDQRSQVEGVISYDSGLYVSIENFPMTTQEDAQQIHAAHQLAYDMSTKGDQGGSWTVNIAQDGRIEGLSMRMPGVDIDAAHRAHADAIATGTGILLASTEGIEHVPYAMILHPDPAKEWDQALRGESQAGIVDTEGKPIVYDLTLQGFTKGEATTEPAPEIVSIATGEPSTDPAVVTIPYEGPERRGVHIPGAIWPDPAKSKFSLKDDSSPMNPGNRHAPLKRRHDD